ncbi:MAG: hypothetical protein WCC04_05020 [Terriglobales bacterium]
MKRFEESQGSSEHHEGWRYFFEKTDLKAGTDPAEATHRRQTQLEVRESNAMQETKPSIAPSAHPQR